MKRYFIMTFCCLLWLNILAQTPHAFNYQSVVRDLSGNLLVNKSVRFRLTILSGSISGPSVYSELHLKTTNGFGLVNLEIGKGTSPVGNFTTISWGNNIYFLKVEMDPEGGTSYQNSGTSQLLSVPYSLYAKDVQNNNDADADPANELQKISLNGTILTLDRSGGSVTLPSSGGGDNWGTQTVVTDASMSGNGTTTTPLKIADNGVTSSKIADNSILSADLTDNSITTAKISNLAVTSDKIKDAAVTGTKIAQEGATQGQVLKWTGSTWDNANDDHGPFYESTNYIYAGTNKNVGIGTAVPTQRLTLADESSPCYMNIQNVNSGYTSYDGMFLGMSGLNSYVSSYEAGSLYLGTNADIRMAIVSDGKVGIGTLTPSYKLDVKGAANLNKGIASGPALTVNTDEAIWYDGTYFSWGYGGLFNVFHDPVGIACQPGDGHKLAVNGVASKPGGGTWAAFSDIRLKNIHGKYERGLNDILRLQPVMFNYKKDNPLKLPSDVRYVGFIAQEVQPVFPETVTENKNGYLEFDMSEVNVALVNAFKELNAKVEALQKENALLKAINERFNARLEKLEHIFGGSVSAEKP